MNPRLHFQRFEFKYILTTEQFLEIRRFLRHYLKQDPVVEDTKNGFYEVISLYYDSPRFHYYWEKIDGAKRRRKIRLRTYKKDNVYSENIFFEIKRKHDAVILKDRFMFKGGYKDVDCSNDLGKQHIPEDTHTAGVLNEYSLERARLSLSPKLLVAYNREPYVGMFNKDVRITFDYGVRAKQSREIIYEGGNYTDVSLNKVIMEVKFKGSLPFYIIHAIRMHNLQRVPYSKYCEGLEACYSLPLLEVMGRHSQSDSLHLKRRKLLIN